VNVKFLHDAWQSCPPTLDDEHKKYNDRGEAGLALALQKRCTPRQHVPQVNALATTPYPHQSYSG